MPRGKSPETEAEGEREGEEVGLVSPAHAAADREGGSAMRCVAFAHEDPLLALTLLGVVVGLVFGLLLTAVLPGVEDTTGTRKTIVKLVSFPGKMFLNLLKMMVVPLISGSMIAGVCALQSAGANTGKLARVTFSFFAATTLIAVFIGLVVVNVIQPGVCEGWCAAAGCAQTCARARARWVCARVHARAMPAGGLIVFVPARACCEQERRRRRTQRRGSGVT
jgi:L-cystine uptake protein TcyP (sodium:dicarboxylate symporter family)